MKTFYPLVAVLGLLLGGCSESTTTVGEPGEAGTYKRSMNRVGDAASKASDRVEQDAKDLGGN